MQSLGEIFKFSVSELLQGKRLETEAVISISEQNVVKSIKKNKMLKMVIAVVAVLAVIASSVSGTVAIKNARNPLIENNIYIPSKDIRSQLDNIQSFIDPTESKNFNITWLKVFLNSDKKVSDFYIEGVTGEDVYYHCGCQTDTDTLFTGIKRQKNGLQVLIAINLLNFLIYLIFQR